MVLTYHRQVCPAFSSFQEGPDNHNIENGANWSGGETLHFPVCSAEVLHVGRSQVSRAHVYSLYIKVEQRSDASSGSWLAFSSMLTCGATRRWKLQINKLITPAFTQHIRLMAVRLLLPVWLWQQMLTRCEFIKKEDNLICGLVNGTWMNWEWGGLTLGLWNDQPFGAQTSEVAQVFVACGY